MITTLEEMRRVRAMVHACAAAARGRRGQAVRRRADRADARSAGRRGVDRRAAGGSRFRLDRLERPGAIPDGRRPRQSQGQPPVPAAQPGRCCRCCNSVIAACNEAGKPVTLCGEMAGQPRAFVLLFGMGLRSFSMSPAFIPIIKELTSHLTARAGRVRASSTRYRSRPPPASSGSWRRRSPRSRRI